MKDILVAYLTWKNSINSPNTLKKYTGSVEIYCNMVFGKKPDELTRDDFKNLRYSDTINKFVKPLRDKDIKDSTINTNNTIFSSLSLNFAEDISDNMYYIDSIDSNMNLQRE